jgi:hypothetical protein
MSLWDHISPKRLLDTDGRQWTVNYGRRKGDGPLGADPNSHRFGPPSMSDDSEDSIPSFGAQTIYVPSDW